MKRYIPVLFFALFSFVKANADSVDYYSGSWDAIRAKAKAEHKYIFMDCYTDWCGWCKVMDKETMPDPAIVRLLNEKFIPVRIEMEHGEGIRIAMKYHIWGYPTFVFFNPDGELVYVSNGYQKPARFLGELTDALDKSKQYRTPGFSASMDVDFPELYRQAFAESGKKKFPKPEEVTNYLDEQKDLFSEANWALQARFNGGAKYDSFFIDNIKKYEALYGYNDVKERTYRIIDTRLKKSIKDKDKTELAALLTLVDKYMKDDKERYKLNLRMDYYKETQDWDGYSDALSEYMAKPGADDATAINSICWGLYEKCDDKRLLVKACGYMSKAVAIEPVYNNLDTYAALLYKTGQMSDAEKWADKAIVEGKKSGSNVSGTEALLKKIKEQK